MSQSYRSNLVQPTLLGVVSGPGRGKNAFLYPGETIIVGRRSSSDLHVPDPEVSSRHISFSFTAQGIVATDLNSSNGSWIHGSQEIVSPTLVTGGQTIQLGETTSLFVFPNNPDFPDLPGYKFCRMLGVGSQANVYEAEMCEAPFRAAIKVIKKNLRQKDLQRIIREANLLRSLDHPAIAACYGLREFPGHYVLINELVEGETVEAALTKQQCVPWQTAFNLGQTACEALHYAHQSGVIHRDIKPGNIILCPNPPGLKVIDFGFARSNQGSSSGVDLTSMREIIGTWDYMAPEGFAGAKTLDHRSDVFSLTATIYEMIEGRAPFPETTPGQLVESRQNGPHPMKFAPPHVAEILEAGLQFDMNNRLQSMSELRAHIDYALDLDS